MHDRYFSQNSLVGASVQSMARLAAKLGYSPVWLYQEDLILVKNSILQEFHLRTGGRLSTDLDHMIQREQVRFHGNVYLEGYKINGYELNGRPIIVPTYENPDL